jgi:hypothetical protein
MGDVVKSEGLVIAVTDTSGNVYPFACTKDATINISRDFLELAPRTNGVFREYLANRSSFTVSGSGLVKMIQSNMHAITYFQPFMLGSDTEFLAYLDMIDSLGVYKVYQFSCIFQDLSITSTSGGTTNYSFTLQGTGPLTEITSVDSYVVSSGKITARSTASWKLVAVGIEGAWYYNYSVTNEGGGVFSISVGTAYNGKSVKAAYIPI